MEKTASAPKTNRRRLEKLKEYYSRPEVRARRKAYLKDYRAKNPINKETHRLKSKHARETRPLVCAWGCYKHSAKVRGLEFSIQRQLFEELLMSQCHYCYSPPHPLNGIDRVDNDAGYTAGNCVPCCKLCNRAKADLPIEDFLAWLASIAIAHAK